MGQEYRGTVNVTASGIPCQAWIAQTPHKHSRTEERYPNTGIELNYCRNPDKEPFGPWCYTMNKTRRWEYCNISFCQGVKVVNPFNTCKNTTKGTYYVGRLNFTVSGRTCQRWDSQLPHGHSLGHVYHIVGYESENYCRNPDGEPKGPWCYTMDKNKRWEYCDVVNCNDNCKYVESGIFYRGTANKTKTGKGCLPWKMFLPNLKLLGYPTKALEENYCRNFNKKGAGPWCYVNEDSAFEYCDIPKCPARNCTSEEFTCVEDGGRCIPMKWKCDKEKDCSNGSDESDELKCTEKKQCLPPPVKKPIKKVNVAAIAVPIVVVILLVAAFVVGFYFLKYRKTSRERKQEDTTAQPYKEFNNPSL